MGVNYLGFLMIFVIGKRRILRTYEMRSFIRRFPGYKEEIAFINVMRTKFTVRLEKIFEITFKSFINSIKVKSIRAKINIFQLYKRRGTKIYVIFG